jgi:hypothetical protein
LGGGVGSGSIDKSKVNTGDTDKNYAGSSLNGVKGAESR